VVALVLIVTVLLASAPSVLKLPAASENLVLATLMVALPGVVPAVGVKVAVQTLGSVVLWVRLLRLPPVTAMSSAVKSVLGSDRVKVTVAV